MDACDEPAVSGVALPAGVAPPPVDVAPPPTGVTLSPAGDAPPPAGVAPAVVAPPTANCDG
jgi:hypothetical protein